MGSAFLLKRVGLAALMLLWIASLLCTAAVAGATDLTIGQYELVSSKRITRTVWEYTYAASVTNTGASTASAVIATLHAPPSPTVVIDGTLTFSDVAAGATVKSSKNFTIRVDRTSPSLQTGDLVWDIQYLEASEWGGYIKPANTSKVETDPSTGQTVIRDQIVLVFKDGVSADTAKSVIAGIGGTIVGYLTGLNTYQVEIPGNPSLQVVESIIIGLTQDPNVEVATFHGVATLPDATRLPDPGKDPKWNTPGAWEESAPSGLAWGLDAIYAPSAWAVSTGDSKTKIGVVDGGFDINHEDLLIPPANATGQNSNYLSSDAGANAHGTHVTGTIGALSNNDKGITGIMWEKDLYVYRADVTGNLSPNLSPILGIMSMLKKGVKLINLSIGAKWSDLCVLGWPCPTDDNNARWLNDQRTMMTIFMNHFIAKYGDFLVVQAAGNDRIDAKWTGYFAAVDDGELKKHVIVVANVGKPSGCPDGCKYDLAWTSNRGDRIDVAAPGEDIESTKPSNNYGTLSGTSMAAPHVTGVAGLVWSVNPSLSAAQVRQIIVEGADRAFDGPDGGTYRVLNAHKAVLKALAPVPPPQPVSYTYTTLLPPGWQSAIAYSINDAGQVVGFGDDASGQHRAFLYSGGTYTTLLPPGWQWGDPYSINDAGQVVGFGSDASGQPRGFLANP